MAGHREWLRSMAIVMVMKMCMSITFKTVRSIKVANYIWSDDTQRCIYHQQSDSEPYVYFVPVYLVEFFLPVLGGLIVDKWLGELMVLRVAGAVLLVSGVYVTAMELSHQICRPALYLLGLAPSCLAYGLGLAPLLATPMKLSHGRFGSPTIGLLSYFASACTGEFLGSLPGTFRHKVNLTWVACASPLVYIAVSVTLKLDWSDYRRRVRDQLEDGAGFVFPTRARLLRYFILLAPLVVVASLTKNVRSMIYCPEMNYYLNCTGNCSRVTCGHMVSSYSASTMSALLLLCCLYKTGRLAKEGRLNARFYTGVSIILVGKAALIPWNCWAAGQSSLPDPTQVHFVYICASGLDGLGNGFAMASGYELMYRIAPACSRNLIMGFLFTIWAIGACFTAFKATLLVNFPLGGPVLRPVLGQWNRLYVVYVVMVIESILLLLYYRVFCTRLAKPLIPVEDDVLGADDDDLTAESLQTLVSDDEAAALSPGEVQNYRSCADSQN